MDQTRSTPTMHALYLQLSGLVGLFIFLCQMWSHVPLDQTLFQGCAAGMVAYLGLILFDAAIRRILAFTPPALADESAGASAGRGRRADGGTRSPAEKADRAQAPAA